MKEELLISSLLEKKRVCGDSNSTLLHLVLRAKMRETFFRKPLNPSEPAFVRTTLSKPSGRGEETSEPANSCVLRREWNGRALPFLVLAKVIGAKLGRRREGRGPLVVLRTLRRSIRHRCRPFVRPSFCAARTKRTDNVSARRR